MDSGDDRACPSCAEIIKGGAIVCRFCGRDIPVSDAPAPKTFAAEPKDHGLPLSLQPSPKAPPTYKSYWYITVPITLLLILAWRNRSSFAGHIHEDEVSPAALTSHALDSEAKADNRSSVAGHIHEDEVSPAALTSPALDSEAKAEVVKVFDGMVSKCGDKYYKWGGVLGHHRAIIMEMTERPRLDTRENMQVDTPVSDVDRMNGLTWNGGSNFTVSIYRELLPHEIRPWQEGSGFGIGIKKLNGVWLVQQDYSSETMSQDWIPIDSFSDNVPCEQVSGYLSQDGVSRTDSQ
jgi:hypothetical protein